MDQDQSQLKTEDRRPKTGDSGSNPGLPSPVTRLLICLILLLSVGCRIAGREPRSLRHAQPSAEALAERVLEALAKQDEQSLKGLVLTKEEFCTYVWPELPSSEIKNLTCDWVWDSFYPSDVAGLRQTLRMHGGKQYSLVRVRFAKGVTEYKTFKVHEESRVVVKDDSGQEREFKLFGSMLELEGQFKLLSFVVD